MPVACPSLTSGTITIGRSSRRPRATSTSRSLATRCLVPRSSGERSVRLAMSRAMPPRSTRAIVDGPPGVAGLSTR